MIQENIALAPLTTFHIEASARYFAAFQTVDELRELINWQKENNQELLVLGGGSNVLFVNNWKGVVLQNQLKGIDVIQENENQLLVKVGAGEVWHEWVMHCVDKGWGGIENMSLVPGSVGASPMQNIGAYGVEVKDVFESLEAFHIATGEVHTFTNEECQFGYRESVFKRKLKGQYIILNVTYRLNKNAQVNTQYGAIQSELEVMGITETPSIKEVSNAVIRIRESKLPNPDEIGNAGSFFKNPIISEDEFKTIKENHPTIPAYPAPNGMKLAAGWLIEQAGWKGKRFDDYGVYTKQALVLVNYDKAKGQDVYDLSEQIITSVFDGFGVKLEREVNVVG